MRIPLLALSALVFTACSSGTEPSLWSGTYRLQAVDGAPAPWSDFVTEQSPNCHSLFAVDSATLTLGPGANLSFREYGKTQVLNPFPPCTTTVKAEFATYTTDGDAITITSAGTRFINGTRNGSSLSLQAQSDLYTFVR